LAGKVDFVPAFAVVHELPDAESFFREAAELLKPGASLFLVEPAGHVNAQKFEAELAAATRMGLSLFARPAVRRNSSALLRKA
jgi:SAM-dependent methyltransferase